MYKAFCVPQVDENLLKDFDKKMCGGNYTQQLRDIALRFESGEVQWLIRKYKGVK